MDPGHPARLHGRVWVEKGGDLLPGAYIASRVASSDIMEEIVGRKVDMETIQGGEAGGPHQQSVWRGGADS